MGKTTSKPTPKKLTIPFGTEEPFMLIFIELFNVPGSMWLFKKHKIFVCQFVCLSGSFLHFTLVTTPLSHFLS